MMRVAMKLSIGCVIFAVLIPALASAAESSAVANEPSQVLKLAEGRLHLSVPANWKVVKPRNRIIQHEFSIPVAGEDKIPGRMTIMAASGGIEANIARWAAQFRSANGKTLDDDAKNVEKKTVSGLDVHLVDISGDYQDKPRGPFGPSVNRPNYRMLAAIIQTKGQGTWFIKLYGPQATIKATRKHFGSMIEGIVWKAQ